MKFEIAPKSTEIQANWDDARLYCFSLDIDGKTGWRLPTKEELNKIYYSDNDFEKRVYWSSTENGGNDAWGQAFYFCAKNYYSGYKDNIYYVRAIRSTV